ncbi:MAG: FtsX-like permease family protein [Planctomycetota bacterium]|nr:FtsX-like permease family protein [Planctomycetota bacterium]
MRILIKLAWRNIRRNRRRTLITAASITLGLAVILWLEGVLEARNRDMIETVTSGHLGHIQVYSSAYASERSLLGTLDRIPDALTHRLPAGSHLSTRVILPALISRGPQSSQVVVVGVEPEGEAAVTELREHLVEGEYLSPVHESAATPPIYLSRLLAQLLRAVVGQQVRLTALDRDGQPANGTFEITGFYDSGSPAFDQSYAFAPLWAVQQLASLRGFHEIVVRLPDGPEAEHVRDDLDGAVSDDIVVTTWRTALPELATLITFNEALVAFVTSLMFIVVALGVMNTMLMSVFERTREFGIMSALGTTPSQIVLLVILESLIVGVISAGLGLLLGTLAIMYHRHTGLDLHPFLGESSGVGEFRLDLVVHPILPLLPFLRTIAGILFVVVGTALYPAIRASRFLPVEAIRAP